MWYRLEILYVPKDVDRRQILLDFGRQIVFGLRLIQVPKRKKYKLRLAFKSEAARDAAILQLRALREANGYDLVDVCEQIDSPTSYDSIYDIPYVEQSFARAHDIHDLQGLLALAPPSYLTPEYLRDIHEFCPPSNVKFAKALRMRPIDYARYPPLRVLRSNCQPRKLTRVEFPISWLLDLPPIADLDDVHQELRRLKISMIAHSDQPTNATVHNMWVPIVPTLGPYERILRCIATLAMHASSTSTIVTCTTTRVVRFHESMGYYASGRWFIEWDLSLDALQFRLGLEDDLWALPR